MMDADSKRLVKHSVVEDGQKVWWLYEFRYQASFCAIAEDFDYQKLQRFRFIRLIQRFESEEELEIFVILSYGKNCIVLEK